jgi:hypothetical protein
MGQRWVVLSKINKGTKYMKISANARIVSNQWKTNQPKAQRHGYIDCSVLLSDIWEHLPDSDLEKLMSDDATDFLRHDNLKVAKKYGRKTMTGYHTYVQNLVIKKFGQSSVIKDYGPNGFRGFKDSPDIKDYARKTMQVTIDRVLLCL